MSDLWNGPFESKEIARVVGILSSLCLFLTIMVKEAAGNNLVPPPFFKAALDMMSEFERGAMIEFISLTLLLFIVVLSSSFFKENST